MSKHSRHLFPVQRESADGKGEMLSVEDVVKKLKGTKTERWVRNHFAPEFKHKLGREPFWWEADANRWLNSL